MVFISLLHVFHSLIDVLSVSIDDGFPIFESDADTNHYGYCNTNKVYNKNNDTKNTNWLSQLEEKEEDNSTMPPLHVESDFFGDADDNDSLDYDKYENVNTRSVIDGSTIINTTESASGDNRPSTHKKEKADDNDDELLMMNIMVRKKEEQQEAANNTEEAAIFANSKNTCGTALPADDDDDDTLFLQRRPFSCKNNIRKKRSIVKERIIDNYVLESNLEEVGQQGQETKTEREMDSWSSYKNNFLQQQQEQEQQEDCCTYSNDNIVIEIIGILMDSCPTICQNWLFVKLEIMFGCSKVYFFTYVAALLFARLFRFLWGHPLDTTTDMILLSLVPYAVFKSGVDNEAVQKIDSSALFNLIFQQEQEQQDDCTYANTYNVIERIGVFMNSYPTVCQTWLFVKFETMFGCSKVYFFTYVAALLFARLFRFHWGHPPNTTIDMILLLLVPYAVFKAGVYNKPVQMMDSPSSYNNIFQQEQAQQEQQDCYTNANNSNVIERIGMFMDSYPTVCQTWLFVKFETMSGYSKVYPFTFVAALLFSGLFIFHWDHPKHNY